MTELDLNFFPVGESKGFLDIVRQIREHIEKGILKVGNKLPAERDLAEKFKTSRATVREALRALEIIGVIESRVGQGTFIKATNFSGMNGLFTEISKQTSPSEVFEVRFAIEPYLAKMAALRANHEDLHKLQNILDQMNATIQSFDIKQFEQLDGEFHNEIALSSKNSFFLYLMDIINNVRKEKLWGTLKEKSLNPERMVNYFEEHTNIYKAIYERDARRAEVVALQHLKTVRNNMLGT